MSVPPKEYDIIYYKTANLILQATRCCYGIVDAVNQILACFFMAHEH